MKKILCKYKSNKYLLGILILLFSCDFLSKTNLQNNPDQALALASRRVKRFTRLKPVIPKRRKVKKEIDLKMADPALSKKWGLKQTHSAKAWKKLRATGSRGVIVAVIDTGIDTRHPDLTANLWINRGEVGYDKQGRDKATNGIDDDKNGYVDDLHGWNFVGQNNDLTDNHGHGTHIAGIIGAEGGNGIGISGVAPRVSLMVLKYFDPVSTGFNNLSNTVKSIQYAIDNGAKIINYSGGGLEKSPYEKKVIALAKKKGILFVAAAGNEKTNSDLKGYYPADYSLNNIISVTAVDRLKNILPTSNFGKFSVDIAAPGNDIYSTLPNGAYGPMTGTSQATAFVSGVAALILARHPSFKAPQLIKHLTETGDFDKGLKNKTRYRKRLNTYRALAMLDDGMTASGVTAHNSPTFSGKTNLTEKSYPSQGQSLKSFGQSMQNILTKIKKPTPNKLR